MSDDSRSMLDTGVFERRGRNTISASSFYFLIGVCLCWGLGLTVILANHFAKMDLKTNIWMLLGIGLVIPVIGVLISAKSDNAFISFIGYNMVVAPFGFLLAPIANVYSPNVVRDAAMITLLVTGVMGAAGTMFPSVFAKMGGALFVALLGLVTVRLVQCFVPQFDFGWIDYASALIFSLYIGYDMYRANNIGQTADNAVDVSVSLYLDIINLFISILRILGSKK